MAIKKITDPAKLAAMRARAEAGKRKRAARLAKEKADRDAKRKSQQVSQTQQTVSRRKPVKATTVTIEQPQQPSGTVEGGHVEADLPIEHRVARADGNLTEAEIAQNRKADAADAARRRRAERKRKQRFQSLVKKWGGSENVLKKAEKKFWVNSSQYRKIRNEIKRYEWSESKVRTIKTQKDTGKIDTKKGLTQDQFNKLITKFWDTAWVNAAIESKFWKNSSQARRVKNLLNKFDKPTTKKVRENISTITDVSKADIWDEFAWAIETEEAKPTFKWNSIVDFLKSENQNSSFSNRAKLAKEAGIEDYRGTSSQNTTLLNSLRNKKVVEDQKKSEEKIESTEEKTESTEQKTTPWKLKTQETEKQRTKTLDALAKRRLGWETDADILKKVEDRYGADSEEYRKLKDFINANPEKKWDEEIDSSLLDQTKEELEKGQIDALEDIKDDNISTTAENFIKGSDVISQNNKNLQDFYVTMADDLRTFLKTAEKNKRAALAKTKSSRLNQVVGQIRATLARRGVDIGKIAPEQLIAMAGQLWADAMEDINDAITETENSIIELTQNSTNQINALKEKWLIKQGEADASIEQMRQLKEKMISDIRANFVSNAFKISRASVADKDQNKAEVLNTISTFVSQLGISGTAQGIMENFLDAWDSVEALQNMIQDLNDTESELYKAVADVEKSNQLAAEFKAKIELLKATKTPKASWSSTPKIEYSSTIKNILLAHWIDPNDYPTNADLLRLQESNPWIADDITQKSWAIN